MRRNNNGLKLDLTENTPGSSAASRLPNLVEHAENSHHVGIGSGSGNGGGPVGENLSSKLPNVVEGSMDYGSERRASLYYDHHHHYEANGGGAAYPDGLPGSYVVGEHQELVVGYMERDYGGRGVYDPPPPPQQQRKPTVAYDSHVERYEPRLYPAEEQAMRYERQARAYQESDLDAPYDRSSGDIKTQTLGRGGGGGGYHQPSHLQSDPTRRYSRDLTDYEYVARYAEETLKLEAKHHHGLSAAPKGYESGGVKTRDSNYELSAHQQQQPGDQRYEGQKYVKYGTLPRYDAAAGGYQNPERSYETKYAERAYDGDVKSFEPSSSSSKYQLTSSKSYERGTRYNESGSASSRYNHEQTLKIGEDGGGAPHSTSGGQPYPRKPTTGGRDKEAVHNAEGTEKMNGCRKNNFEAYGVYSDPEDDHGFLANKKAPKYTYKGVVVNASGESSVVEQKKNKEARLAEAPRSPWCRLTILLLLLVLLVVIFVFVAGIILYINCELDVYINCVYYMHLSPFACIYFVRHIRI